MDVYMLSFAKEMWEAIETKFGISNARSECYMTTI
jgi:hypothetical protein